MLERRRFLQTALGLGVEAVFGHVPCLDSGHQRSLLTTIPEQQEYEEILARSPGLNILGRPHDWSLVREGCHPFSPERILFFTPKMVQESVRQNRSARELIRRQTERWRHGFQPALDMPAE